MGATSLWPGDAPVSLDEARGWLRLGAAVDDDVAAALVRAATNICEMFIGQWLMARDIEEILPLRGGGTVRLNARPVIAVDTVALRTAGGGEAVLDPAAWRLGRDRDGSGRLAIDGAGDAARVRVAYRAGMAETAAAVPEAVRHGIVRMVQHLYDARDGTGAAPPAVIAALWQPWRLMMLGSGK